jgi:hypothetical protein
MSLFPAFPTNGQTTTVNGTLYTYNSAQTAWIRTNANTTVGLSVTGNISVSGSLTSGNLADAVGYKGIPQNARTSQYTLALSDMGFHISITTGGVIIPANSSVPFPIGSTVVVYNNSASTQTISITTDTLRQTGTTVSTDRVILNAYGLATLIKVASTVWVVSGNLVPLSVVNYLIVAGGGGSSGSSAHGGGGGGGVLSGSAPIFIASYAVTVGLAGAFSVSPTNGGNSSALGQTAIGGGAGGTAGVNGNSGGSGGGGGSSSPPTAGGAGTSGQGFAGGAGTSGGVGGGGGGAGGVGGTTSGGNGGPALSSSITGTAVNYGGGGRGASAGSSAASAYGEGAGANIGIGKAGVVIIAYPTGSMIATGGTITTSGINTIHTFTSDGIFQRTA